MDLNNYVRNIPDFPKKGVLFKDITPLLQDAKALVAAKNGLIKLLKDIKVDKVVGIESRGFFFAPLLAGHLNAGFVPVRKSGKLPFSTVHETYALEYGYDTLEMHSDAIVKGDKVLVHDDVLDTGGTANAVCKLVERLGGEVVQCNFLLEISDLNGREMLKGHAIASLLRY